MAKTASSLTVTKSSRLAAARPSAPHQSGAHTLAMLRERGLTAPLLDAGTRPSSARTSPAASARTVAGAAAKRSRPVMTSHLQLQNVAGATSSTSCRRRPSAPLQRAFQALSSCSTLSCSALSSSDQRRPRPRSFSTRTSTRRCRPSSRRSVEPRRRCRRAPCRRCRR